MKHHRMTAPGACFFSRKSTNFQNARPNVGRRAKGFGDITVNGILAHGGENGGTTDRKTQKNPCFSMRRFKSEVQRCSIDGMAE
jgi:hypothetical protein